MIDGSRYPSRLNSTSPFQACLAGKPTMTEQVPHAGTSGAQAIEGEGKETFRAAGTIRRQSDTDRQLQDVLDLEAGAHNAGLLSPSDQVRPRRM